MNGPAPRRAELTANSGISTNCRSASTAQDAIARCLRPLRAHRREADLGKGRGRRNLGLLFVLAITLEATQEFRQSPPALEVWPRSSVQDAPRRVRARETPAYLRDARSQSGSGPKGGG